MTSQTNDPPSTSEAEVPRRFRLPLAGALAVAFGALVALAVAAVLLISYVVGRDSAIELMREREELTVSILENRLADAIHPAAEQLAVVATILERNTAISYGRLRIADLLSGAVAARQIASASFTDPEGTIIEVTPGHEVGVVATRIESRAQQAETREALDHAGGREGGWWEGLAFGAGEPTLVRRQSVWRDGRFFGLLTARIGLRAISAAVARVPGAAGGSAGAGFVLLGREQVLGHPVLISEWGLLEGARALPPLASFRDQKLASVWSPAQREERGAGGLLVRVIPLADDVYIFSLRTLYSYGPEPLTLGHYRPARELGAELYRIQVAAFAGLGVLGLAVVIAGLIGRGLTRPIVRLAEAANELRAFRFGEMRKLPPSLLAEIDDQARAFNDMTVALRWFESYVPKALVRRLVRRTEGGDFPSVERELTIFFSDIAGFTAMSERLGAAEAAALLNHHIALIVPAIEATGGTVDKFIGDSVMAFWGAPKRQDDHAERALRASLATGAAIAADNAARRALGQPPIRVRIGLHTGRVLVGNIGAPGRVNYTIIGDAVNVAERLQELGKEVDRSGADVTILLSGAMAARLPPGLPVRRVGNFTLRGRAGSVEVFQAAAQPASPAATPAPATRAVAP